MNQLIIISLCERKLDKGELYGYRFRFEGAFRGSIINKIDVKTSESLKVNSAYFLTLKLERLSNNCLITKLIDYKELKKYHFD